MRNFRNTRSYAVAIIILIAAFGGVAATGKLLNSVSPPLPAGYEDEQLVFRGENFKAFSLGLNGLIADWYWMRSLQYLGGKLAKKPDVKINVNDLREFDPRLLHPLLDNAVSFDPQFIAVYEYGAVVLPAIDPKKAVAIVEKGIAANPREWRLYNHLGYIYWRNGDYDKAAEAYTAASTIEGAPPLMRSMAAKMKTDAGSRETAREIYTEIYQNARDDNSRKTARANLIKLDSLDEIDAINSVLKKHAQCPKDLREILPELSRLDIDLKIDDEKRPVDGSGVPYFLDAAACRAGLDRERTTLPVD